MSRLGSRSPGWPTKLVPIMPERPRPSSVSDRPVATWLVASDSVMTANSSENTAPMAIAAKQADPGRTGEIAGAEAADRAHDHHAFDAEIEHAGALDHQFADRRDQQGRRRGGDGQKDVDGDVHQRASFNFGAASSFAAPSGFVSARPIRRMR